MEVRMSHGEGNLEELAGRLFRTRGSRAGTRRVLAALRQANPHLDPRKPIPPGTPILVPPVEGIDPAPAPGPSADVTKQAVADLREALRHAGEALDEARARAAGEDESVLAQLKKSERELKALGDEATEGLKQSRDAVKARQKESAGQVKVQEDGLKQLQAAIDQFVKRLG